MEQVFFESEHWNDEEGRPAGGSTYGTGFCIAWQTGPLVTLQGDKPVRKKPNGAFVEEVIRAAADRLRYYQRSKFACGHNERALRHLDAALAELDARTADREARGVEGTHQE